MQLKRVDVNIIQTIMNKTVSLELLCETKKDKLLKLVLTKHMIIFSNYGLIKNNY